MKKLETMTAEQLQSAPYSPVPFLVDELLPEGLHILAGAPKIGKSWLALWLCLCVSQGQPLWNFAVTQGEVLYLSLEDSYRRIQSRLFDLTEDAPQTLHFAIMANTLKHGLEQQIEQFLTEHPATKLVVIDTLQRVRSTGGDSNLYAKDTSRKVRAVKKLQAERGERLGGKPPYGYKTSEADPTHLEPDAEAAEVVRQIFTLCASGKGPSQIARILTEQNILTPANYYFQKTGKTHHGRDPLRPCAWSGTTVSDILGNLVYLGHTVGLRRTTISYKNKTIVQRPESEQFLVENTHPPLISQEQWQIVQEVRQHKKRTAKQMDEPNLFSGLVFCADCGKPMVLHRATTMKKLEYNFKCYTYGKKGKNACSAHHIRECDLTQIVLDDLRRVTHFARMKERQFAAYINQKNSAELRQEINRILQELDTMKRRSAELAKLFKRLYEDNVLGRVTDEQYRMLAGDYTDEQRLLEEEIPKKEERLAQLKSREANVEAFIEKAKRFTTIDELTPELLRLFIQRIEIGERDVKYSRNASQSIRIIYRDIGLVDSAMQPDEQQPKILPPLSEVIPLPA